MYDFQTEITTLKYFSYNPKVIFIAKIHFTYNFQTEITTLK